VRRLVLLAAVVAVGAFPLAAAGKDTPKAAAARKLLKKKVSVDYKETRITEVVEDLQEQVKGLRFRVDNRGGVSNNQTITFKADDKPLDEVLEGMFKKNDLGYVVISNPRDTYDGTVLIKKGKERGYAKGQEPDKGKDKD